MRDFFYGEMSQTIEWFGLTHILILVVFFYFSGLDLDIRSKIKRQEI